MPDIIDISADVVQYPRNFFLIAGAIPEPLTGAREIWSVEKTLVSPEFFIFFQEDTKSLNMLNPIAGFRLFIFYGNKDYYYTCIREYSERNGLSLC